MIDFPANPAVNDTFTVGNTIYKCLGINPNIWGVAANGSGIPDAPQDGQTYARRNNAWAVIPAVASIAAGGTGATTAAQARVNLGLTNAGGQLLAADGTIAAPGIAFASEASTGIYRPGATQIATAIGGIKVYGLTLSANDTYAAYYPKTAGSNAILSFASAPPGTVDYNQINIGFGSGGYVFTGTNVGAATAKAMNFSGAASYTFDTNLRAPNLSVDNNFYSALQSGNPILNFDANDFFKYDRSINELQLIRSGVTSTLFKNNGDIYAGGNLYTGSAGDMGLVNVSGASKWLRFTSDNWRLEWNNGYLSFVNNTGTVLNQFTTSGEFVCRERVHIRGGGPKVGFQDANGNERASITDQGNGTLRVNSQGFLYDFQTDGNFVLQSGTSATKPGGGPWNVLSDISVKRNIVDYTRGLDDILKYRPIAYQYVGDEDDRVFVGQVAQEVELIDPSMILINKDGLKMIDGTPDIYKLVNAVKTLHERIARLEAMV